MKPLARGFRVRSASRATFFVKFLLRAGFLDYQTSEGAQMAKASRKRKNRKKKKANHGKRPNS